MNTEQLKEIIRQELPTILQDDEQFRLYVLRIAQQKFADRQETESRFDRLISQLERNREEDARRWDKAMAEYSRKWDEAMAKLDNQQAEYTQWRAEDKAEYTRWRAEDKAEYTRWRAEDKAEYTRWRAEDKAEYTQWRAEDKAEIKAEMKRLSNRTETQLTAIGARWGMRSEKTFRHALKGLLEEYFQVQVENVIETDELGEVYGRPDEIELDIIIKNGLLIICELKSSMSYSDMNTFERKARFYERKHQRLANRYIVISPMVSPSAKQLADTLNVEVFSHVDDIGEI